MPVEQHPASAGLSCPRPHLRADGLEPARAVGGLAIDIDGTLLTDDKQIATSSVHAVGKAVAAGLTVVLASARSPEALKPIADQLGLSTAWFVAGQGAVVGRWAPSGEPQVLEVASMGSEAVEAVVAALGAGDVSVAWFSPGRWYVRSNDARMRRQAEVTGLVPVVVDLKQHRPDAQTFKMMLVVDDDEHQLLAEAVAHFPSSVEAVFSHHYMLEVTQAKVTKATGLARLAHALDLELRDFAALGDGDNDVPLLRDVGYGIAMGNAPRHVKAVADEVTADNNHDGVAAAIHHLLDGSWSSLHAGRGHRPGSRPAEGPRF